VAESSRRGITDAGDGSGIEEGGGVGDKVSVISRRL
jgi:hypothetical protein